MGQFDRAAHGSTTTTTGQSGPCQILLLKVTQKKKKKADSQEKLQKRTAFCRRMVHLLMVFFLLGQALGYPKQTQTLLQSNGILSRNHVNGQENKLLEVHEDEGRVRREARMEPLTGISITNNFEILRRRYIDTMERARIRANQRKRSQIEQNSNFLQNVG